MLHPDWTDEQVTEEVMQIKQDDSMLPDGWHFAYDTATPTCRLDNQPYDAESDATQHYVIDGFILSPNVELTGVQTQDDGFRFSDHNPVLLNIRLK